MNIVGFPYRFGFIAKSQTGPHFSICLTDVAVKNRHLGSIVLLRHGMRFSRQLLDNYTKNKSESHKNDSESQKTDSESHISTYITYLYLF